MRILMSLAVMMSLASATLMADEAKVANCEANAVIVQKLVDMRKDRVHKAKALARLTQGEETVAEHLLPVVPGMVDWIYGLKRQELKRDVVGSFKKACLAY